MAPGWRSRFSPGVCSNTSDVSKPRIHTEGATDDSNLFTRHVRALKTLYLSLSLIIRPNEKGGHVNLMKAFPFQPLACNQSSNTAIKQEVRVNESVHTDSLALCDGRWVNGCTLKHIKTSILKRSPWTSIMFIIILIHRTHTHMHTTGSSRMIIL